LKRRKHMVGQQRAAGEKKSEAGEIAVRAVMARAW